MSLWNSRFFRLFARPTEVAALAGQVEDLRATVNSMAQDIQTLHGLLGRTWPDGPEQYRADYRAERAAVMVSDAGGRGPLPPGALYGYTLEPEDFLVERLGATADDLARFRQEVEERQQLT